MDDLPASAQRRSYRACFDVFIVEARAIPASERVAYPGDARLCLANVRVGLDDVCADPAMVARHMPLFPLAQALEAADVGRALVHAVVQTSYAPTKASRDPRLVVKDVAAARRRLLTHVRALADRDLLPADRVATLGRRKGNATLDDVSVCVELLTAHDAAVRGQHPFTRTELDALRADVDWLRENTTPKGARKPAKTARSVGGDLDALWTLLVRRHALLERVAGHFHGAALGEHVPPLRSRVHRELATEEESDPTPPTPPTPR